LTHLLFILDRVTNALAVEPPQANQQHLLILDVARNCQELDEELDALVGDHADGVLAIEQPDLFARLLAERLALEVELTRLVSQPCCCAATAGDDETDDTENDDVLYCPSRPKTIVHACLDVFAAIGDPDAMASADLVNCLRDLPGVAEERWPYADLTQARLAKLLAPYKVRTRDTTVTNGRCCKAYRRQDLLAARPAC
jgi:hypothetical protein